MKTYFVFIAIVGFYVNSVWTQTNSVQTELSINTQGFAIDKPDIGTVSYFIPTIRFEFKIKNDLLFSIGGTFYHQQFGWYDHFMVRQVLIPTRIMYLFGRNQNKFETGLGIMPGYSWSLDSRIEPINPFLFYPEIITGYRIESNKKPIIFRCGISHEIEYFSTLVYNPIPYISIGYKY